MTVTAGRLELREGGQISSSTFTEGDAGEVTVVADRLLIDGAGAEFFTGISSDASGGSGDAGTVTVTAGGLELSDGGVIASSSLGSGPAGDVLVTAETLTVDDAEIRTEGVAAEGGRISVAADRLIHLIDADVTTNGIRPGAGDSIITLQAPTIVLNSSRVTSLTGEGEPITGSGEARLLGELTVISPDSEVAASSTLEVSGLESDITAGIEVLPGAFFDVSGQLRGSCAARQSDSVSSFVQTGQGGVTAGPDALLAGSYAGLIGSAAVPAGAPSRRGIAASGECEG